MPDLNSSSKMSAKSSSVKKSQSTSSKLQSSTTAKSRETKRPSGKSVSPAPPRHRPRRRSRSSSVSQTSSSSSDSDSGASSGSNSSQSSKESPKKVARPKDAKPADRPKPVIRSSEHSTKTDSASNPTHKSTREQPKKTSASTVSGVKASESTRLVTSGRAATSPTPKDSVKANAASEAQTTLTVVNTLEERSATTQKNQPSTKITSNSTKVDETEVEKSVRERSKSPAVDMPKFTRVLVEKLTRNITKAHVQEIFSVWGTIQSVDMPADRLHPEFSRSYAYVTYENPKSATDAVNFMNGGQIDGEVVRVTEVLPRSTVSGRGDRGPSSEEKAKYRARERDIPKSEVEKSVGGAARTVRDERIPGPRRPDDSTDRHRERERRLSEDHSDRRRDTREPERDRRDRDRDHDRDRLRIRDRSRERDRSRADRPRRVRRGSSGSPFANRSGPADRPRSPLTTSRYRRPSPPISSRADAGSSRRPRSRSPLPKSQPTARSGADGKSSPARRGRGATSRSSSSSSSDSDSSNSSSSRSGSSSSSSSSSSRSRS
ncbi:RNA-binding protein with serine-rich domain 1 [Paragonimus heterotremus]|uniref:RNA-binding protein with serine-rich domain 1 n=1 Tax=Paragonimus heterotremus TaxID=100268 RepID=A0A8J4SKM5_9TREM|nr:RNA-binding protein with serine-rich domain 1 [Paragonimus heterotremus]